MFHYGVPWDHDLGNMFYADDTQLYVEINPKDSSDCSTRRLEKYISKIKIWMQQNMLKLNDNKMEELLLGSPYLREIQIMSVKSVHNLGAYFDE